MKNFIGFHKTKWLYIILLLLLPADIFGWVAAAEPQTIPSGDANTWYGLYTDATSYEPGDTIQIYGSAPNEEIVFRLVRLDTDWTEITRTAPMTVSPQSSYVGSFIEYPTVSLSGRVSFTLEGWYHPTLLGGDLTVVAGQIGLSEAAAGIVVLDDGRLAAYVSDTSPTDPGKLAIAPAPGNFENWLDTWHHLALTYDGAQVKLYIDGILAAQRAQTGAVAQVTAPFRLGARAEAPGDLTGVMDGRLDSWAVWPAALSASEVETRHQRGLTEADPVPGTGEADLYINFEGPYPGIDDSSGNGNPGVVTNHGNPGVSGILTDTGKAFRLNHDQIVDAGWQTTAQITIPPGTASGMYAIQALLGPDFEPTQTGERLSVRALAIRPDPNGPHAPIAVVLPTNTWTAYTSWPGTNATQDNPLYGPGNVTARMRYPGAPGNAHWAGNNSAYGEMGDGISIAYYYGWHRPSYQTSPMMHDATTGYYSVRAPNSMYMVQWLDAQGYDYDVFSDDDLDAGLITADIYKVLMPHSHHEYWTDGMLVALN